MQNKENQNSFLPKYIPITLLAAFLPTFVGGVMAYANMNNKIKNLETFKKEFPPKVEKDRTKDIKHLDENFKIVILNIHDSLKRIEENQKKYMLKKGVN